jgi:TetR/AcrR family transcriptional regulator, cholesterol catabolism regulator
VIEVATRLFSEHGYNGTTVRMISDELGILSGSLYSTISGKEQVLREIAHAVGVSFVERAQRAVEGVEDPEAALRAICGAHLEVLHEQQTAVTVYYNEWRRLSAPARQEIIGLRDQYEALITGWVEKGIRTGVFDDSEPRMGVLMILSMLNWTYQWYRPGGRVTPRRLADLYVDAVLRGLRRRS